MSTTYLGSIAHETEKTEEPADVPDSFGLPSSFVMLPKPPAHQIAHVNLSHSLSLPLALYRSLHVPPLYIWLCTIIYIYIYITITPCPHPHPFTKTIYIYILYINTFVYIHTYLPAPLQRVPPGCGEAVQSNRSTVTFLSLRSSSSEMKVPWIRQLSDW